jgi:hypothetical protein
MEAVGCVTQLARAWPTFALFLELSRTNWKTLELISGFYYDIIVVIKERIMRWVDM